MRGTLLLAYASLLVLALADNARMPLFPSILRDLELGDGVGSLLFSCGSAGQIAGSLLGGRVIAGRDARGLLAAALLLVALGTALVAGAREVPFLLLGSAVYGLGAGGVVLAQNLMVERACGPAVRRRAFAGLHAMYALSSLLAPILVAGLRARGWEWRPSLLLVALPALLLMLATPLARAQAAPSLAGRPAPRSPLRPRLLVGGMVALYVFAEVALSSRLPLLFERMGRTPDEGAWALAAFFACLLLGRTLAALVAIPLSNRRLLLGSLLVALGLYVPGLLLQPWLLPLVALPLAPFFPVSMDLVAEELRDDVPGALATLMALVSIALVVGQFLLGALSDRVDLRVALLLGPAALTGAVALALASRPRAG